MRRSIKLAATVGAVAALLGAGITSAAAATVCCYRWADAKSVVQNEVSYGPTVTLVDWARLYLSGNAGGWASTDVRIVTPSGSHVATGGTWTWLTVDPAGEVSNSRGRCHWYAPVTLSGTIPISCEMKYYN